MAKQLNFLAVQTPTSIDLMGAALFEEEWDIWGLVTAENFNVSYTEAMNMTPVERVLAAAALFQADKIRKKSTKK